MKASLAGNTMVKTCLCCTECCFNCFKRFIQVLNMNAYVQVAITGESFCTASVNAKALELKSSGKFVTTHGIGSFISVVGKTFMAVTNTFIGLIIMQTQEQIYSQMESPMFPLVVVFVISYYMAAVIMNVFQTVSLTILQCLYIDLDLS